ncbi:MAG: DNA polymerase III subunit delta [Anaerovoracaceae bacterium]|nr:DNA polymerase III subunit delta [Anaerovoracaceae bacterium]
MYKKEKKEHAFKTFSRDIRESEMPPVLFLYGEEGYLIQWAVETIRSRYVDPACAALDYVRFQDEGEDMASILDACNTFSMMSQRRLVWAEEFSPLHSASARGFTSGDLEMADAYFSEPNPGTILVFTSEVPEPKSELVKLLKKKSRCYEFSQLDYSTLSGFISKRFAAEGVSAGKDAVKAVIDQSGYFNKETEYHLFHLVNDVRKIAAYCGGGSVTEDDVSQVMNGDMDTFIFNLLDAVSGNQKEKAFGLLHNILRSGREVFGTIAMMINQFELLLMVAELKEEGKNLGQITEILKSSEFRIRKAMGYTEKFSVDRLKCVLSQLYETDRNIKTGLMEQNLALELLIGRI